MDGPETVICGGRAPQRAWFWVSLNRWALKLSSISWPASSKNMKGFHQLRALSPSKKTFTVGKTNTDNNDIEFGGFFSLLTTGILKLIVPEHTQSSVASLS